MATNGSYLTPKGKKKKQLDEADPNHKGNATSRKQKPIAKTKPKARKPVAKKTRRAVAKRKPRKA